MPKVTLQSEMHFGAGGFSVIILGHIANRSLTPALMTKLTLRDAATGRRVLPTYDHNNYVSLLPGESVGVFIQCFPPVPQNCKWTSTAGTRPFQHNALTCQRRKHMHPLRRLFSITLLLAPLAAASRGDDATPGQQNPNAPSPQAGHACGSSGPGSGAIRNTRPAAGQPGKGEVRPLQWWTTNASAPSYVFKRGDLEIVTYEKEADYDRLQELYRQSERAQPVLGEMTTRYYRSDIDGSVQPYAVWLPHDYSVERTSIRW